MQWFNTSLKNRFYISILALVTFSLIIIGLTTFYFFKEQNKQYHLKRLQRKEKTVTNSLQYFLNDLNPRVVNEFITKEFDYKVREISDVNKLPIIIYNLSGHLLINTSEDLTEKSEFNKPLSNFLLDSLSKSSLGRLVEKSPLGDISSYSFAYNKKNEKMVIIKIFYHPSNFSDKTEVWAFLERLLLIFFLLFIGAVILAYFLSTYITKSIVAISQKIKKVEIAENNERLNWENNDEIGILVNAYNDMLNKLEFSKEKLAQNERQIAWREMAKQVAHEIKNPLTPMKLSVQHLPRLLESSNIKDKRTLHDFQTKMIQQINLLTEIADEFSNYADLPKGKMKEINLLLILKKLINLFKYESKVKFKINTIKEDSCIIFGDENQLIRVFNNLIQNSLQAMNYQGDIEIIFTNNEKILKIDFIDTGPGIGQEIHDQIFEPKFTTKSQGKGLGLALVKQILDNHNASISILKSTPGAHFLLSFESYEPKN